MSLKNIITTVVILLVIGIVGYFVITGLSGSSTSNVVVGTTGKILPLGSKFDTSLIKKYNADSKLFNYPKVAPGEVGPPLGDIARAPQ